MPKVTAAEPVAGTGLPPDSRDSREQQKNKKQNISQFIAFEDSNYFIIVQIND